MARRDSSARRYAEAAFEVGTRDGTLETWRTELDASAARLGGEEAMSVLANPAIPIEQRGNAVTALLVDSQAGEPSSAWPVSDLCLSSSARGCSLS